MVSADAARAGRKAALHEPVLSKAFTRFRVPWSWNGGPAVLQSRAWDEAGKWQPTRAQIIAGCGADCESAAGHRLPEPAHYRRDQRAINSAGR